MLLPGPPPPTWDRSDRSCGPLMCSTQRFRKYSPLATVPTPSSSIDKAIPCDKAVSMDAYVQLWASAHFQRCAIGSFGSPKMKFP
ncbi:hypothetical protein M378DRAFT_166705 [Amanita muscaria Koide BX008]|uniref:Uncharacterized protein n=1 Tax=Amanita muscaria (strain Koide BX008) TaxID=946122 RepID=A0A0C2WJ99_AMAMK|nr:hypothetical protein M378DRAFT_166705 [Amanita muscaria Koide BX008]